MKALVPTGQSRALVSLADTGVPEPQPGEALVKVEAFSVNRGEIFQLEHPHPGTRPGKDIAGRVVQAAADGTGPAVGQRVAGHPEAGGWAEYAAVPTTALAPLPDSVPVVQAAALPLAGLTALRLLRSAGSVAGRRILLTGASGGVGHYVTELAANSGADITAVTASAERGERLAALGAAAVVHDIGASAGPSVRREIVMIITDPAAAVTRYIDAVRDGDSSAIRECFAEDAIWDYPGDLPLSGTWRGRDSIVDDFLGTVGPALEPGSLVALEVTNVLSVGDQVVAEWTSRATARGGAAYHNRNVGIFTVRDGKITAVREYTDTQHAAHVLFGQP